MNSLPAFDELHVVSDLHMGGRIGVQGFRETERLANFVGRLATQRPGGRLALVLNGDVFDTLAEDIAGFIASDDAVATVRRIICDPSFRPIWQALAGFVGRPHRSLVFVIGNHDLELALPGVQQLLLDTLAGDDFPSRARIAFSAAGAGFACLVGGARIFCTHGNEVDAWNYNRYEDLATLARRLNAGLSMDDDEWRPNAGTRMVKEVINGIKRRYAWIDLLKPETVSAVGALLVLDPAQAGKLGRLAEVVETRRRGGHEAPRRLAADDEDGDDPARAAGTAPAARPPYHGIGWPGVESLLGPNLRACLAAAGDDDDLLAVAERHLTEPRRAISAAPDATLGLPQFAWDRLHGVTPAEALRHALLDWLADDRSFDVAAPDDTCRKICAAVGPSVDFVVTGHTHLERAIDRGQGRYYFNTGTWMRLLRLTPALLASRTAFEPVWRVLGDGRLEAIDAACFDGESFVLDRSSAVAIRREPAPADIDAAGAGHVDEHGSRCTVVGELLHIEGDGRGEPHVVQRFVKGCKR